MPVSQSYWDDDISILSAENVNFAIETAGLGSRFTAIVVDSILQLLVLGLVGIVGNMLADYLPALMEAGKWIRVAVYGLLIILAFLIRVLCMRRYTGGCQGGRDGERHCQAKTSARSFWGYRQFQFSLPYNSNTSIVV